MPTLLQGDIFSASRSGRYGLSIVFGHLGYNFMRSAWEDFSAQISSFAGTGDPFRERAGGRAMFQPGCWMEFHADREAGNRQRGLTDERLAEVLGESLRWARGNEIKEVITNGVCNVDRAESPIGATAINRASDNRRTEWLLGFAKRQETELGIRLTLMSLNDVFVRGRDE